MPGLAFDFRKIVFLAVSYTVDAIPEQAKHCIRTLSKYTSNRCPHAAIV